MSAKQELRKALDTSTTSGGNNLLPYDLDPVLNEELLKLQPLAELIPVAQAESKTHEYTLRTSHPLGWFEGESTGPNYKNSTYARKITMLKIQRIWGSVTGFAQIMDEAFVNALTTELEGSLEGMGNMLEYGAMFACSDEVGFSGDAFQYAGIFPRLAAYAPGNIIDGGSQKITLAHLDKAIAKIGAYRQSRHDPKMWFMGLEMKQVVDGLQSRVQIPLTSTTLNDGQIIMDNYAKAPIYETDMVVPDPLAGSPAVTAVAAAGGALPAGTYVYRIASVTMFGEQVAGGNSANVVADATNKSANLTWTADPNAKLYHIFRKVGAGDFQLVDIIPAVTYDGVGAVSGLRNSYTDTGRAAIAIKPLETGEQQVFLVNRNPDRGVTFLGKVDDMGRQIGKIMTYVELARVKDTYDYLVKSYLGFRVKYPNVAAAVIRHVKIG